MEGLLEEEKTHYSLTFILELVSIVIIKKYKFLKKFNNFFHLGQCLPACNYVPA